MTIYNITKKQVLDIFWWLEFSVFRWMNVQVLNLVSLYFAQACKSTLEMFPLHGLALLFGYFISLCDKLRANLHEIETICFIQLNCLYFLWNNEKGIYFCFILKIILCAWCIYCASDFYSCLLSLSFRNSNINSLIVLCPIT